ncbi:MAG: alcohol dehydrogenase catalytic domain-containing protein [Chloroflexi bacterium]|nr:alcohol dehydrogenase catalytic domain-containing protein [Chloroflexota bacterium]
MQRKRTVAQLVAPRQFELADEVCDIGPNDVWVRVEACGVCNSEMAFYLGIGLKPSDYPLKIGHEGVGVIEEVGADVDGWRVGDRVTSLPLPSYSTHVVANPAHLTRVPDGMELDHALGEPLQCGARCARACSIEFGDHVLFVGCGFMGLMPLAALAGNTAAEIIAADLHPERLELARELGATVTLHASKVDLVAEVMRITAGRGVEVAVEATGAAEPMLLASRCLRSPRPKLVLIGYHNKPATHDLAVWGNGAVVHNPHPGYSLDPQEDIRRGLWAAQKGIFPMQRFITHRFPLAETGRAFEMAHAQADGYIKGIVKPNW